MKMNSLAFTDEHQQRSKEGEQILTSIDSQALEFEIMKMKMTTMTMVLMMMLMTMIMMMMKARESIECVPSNREPIVGI